MLVKLLCYFFRIQWRTLVTYYCYHWNNRSVLVPFREKNVKAAGIAVGSFQESAYWMRGSYNVTVVQSIYPTSLPSSKEIWITICYNYWLLLRVKLPLSFSLSLSLSLSLSNIICLLPYFSHWINALKRKTSDVVNFEQITDPLRPFFFIYLFFLL